jgi:hypothetical protein
LIYEFYTAVAALYKHYGNFVYVFWLIEALDNAVVGGYSE